MNQASTNLGEFEAALHAGTWSIPFRSQTCAWSPGLYALADLLPGSITPDPDALLKLVDPEDHRAVRNAFSSLLRDAEPFELVHRLRLSDTCTRIVLHRGKATYGDDGRRAGSVGILVDITGQELTRRKLDETTAKLMAVWEHVPQGLLLIDPETRVILDANPYSVSALARSRAQIVGRTFEPLFPPEHIEQANSLFARSNVAPVRNIEAEIVTNGDERIPIEVSTSGLFRAGKADCILASFHDISRRRRRERFRARAADTMAALDRARGALVRGTSCDELLQEVCVGIVGGPFCAAWIGESDDHVERRIAVMALAGPITNYLDDILVGEYGGGPFLECLSAGSPVMCRVSDPPYAAWREHARSSEIRASLTLPIARKEHAAVLTIYLKGENEFTESDVTMFASLADDIAFALRGFDAEDLRKRAEVRERERLGELDAALEGALSALAIAFAKRDPYTSEHQKRVAQLARLIAAELHFDSDRSRGLFLAATVHDIGKLSIPIEILAKPTQLTPMEYALVKEHSEIGHGIMSPIKFPWRIAEMVYQHHEYLDGSGYPRGLRGDDILFETRILTCADIVDAMTSFRPYRQSNSLDEALSEISRLAKNKLDPAVVAACLRVIDRHNFRPAEPPSRNLGLID